MEHRYFLVIILGCSLSCVQSFESSEDVFNSLAKSKIQRVDIGVKRPVRFCQGFEDPAEIDCYMRSEVKSYVCTEPATFNPCESLERVETYHYDHILHRCLKVNVPACEGQIIRVLTLLQCLVYCHNKDPFSLGKSISMVYKLNQPKPYIPPEKNEEEKEKVIVNIDQKQDNTQKNPNSETLSTDFKTWDLSDNKSESVLSNLNESPNMRKLNGENKPVGDLTNKDKVLVGQFFTRIPSTRYNKITVQSLSTTKRYNQMPEGYKIEEIILQDIKMDRETDDKEINKKSNEKVNYKKEKMFSKTKPIEVYVGSIKKKMKDAAKKEIMQIREDLAKRFSSIINKMVLINKKKVEIKKEKKSKLDETLKTDSRDKSTDDGFYLWDE